MAKIDLNVENMVDAYYKSNLDADLWDAFLLMMYKGFITKEEWREFRDTYKLWFWNFETNSVYMYTSTGVEEVKRR